MSNGPEETIEEIFTCVMPTLVETGILIPNTPQELANHLRQITRSDNNKLMYLLASKFPSSMMIAAYFNMLLDMPPDAHDNAYFERILTFQEVISHFQKVVKSPWSLDMIQEQLALCALRHETPDEEAHIIRYRFRTVFESSKTPEHLYRSYVVIANMLGFPIDETYTIEDFKRSINMNGEYYSELGESVLRHIDNMLRGEAGLIAWG